MTLAPLLAAAPAIALHAAAAITALALGIAQLALPKGTRRHRVAGWIWAALMLLLAGSSVLIHQIRLWGPFSPIHLLSAITLVGVPRAVWLARTGQVERHRRMMQVLFWLALVGAGAFTLLPGRIMHAVVFG